MAKVIVSPAPEKFITFIKFIKFINFNVSPPELRQLQRAPDDFTKACSETRIDLDQWAHSKSAPHPAHWAGYPLGGGWGEGQRTGPGTRDGVPSGRGGGWGEGPPGW